MATPEQLIQTIRQAKGQVKTPNMQGTRGGPGRGGVAARSFPPPGGGIADIRAKLDAQRGGGPAPSSVFPGPQRWEKPLAAQGGQSASVLTADPGGPDGPIGPAMPEGGIGGPAPTPPTGGKLPWQLLAEQGIGGQGSPRANREKLAELQGTFPGAPATGGGDFDSPRPGGGAPMMPGGDLPRGGMFRGFKPRGGAMMPGGDAASALNAALTSRNAGPTSDAVSSALSAIYPRPDAGAPDMPVSAVGGTSSPSGPPTPLRPGAEPAPPPGGNGGMTSFRGFKPRQGGGLPISPQGGLTARPLPGTAPTSTAGPGQIVTDPTDQMGGFGGRAGSDPRRQAMARRQQMA